MVSDIDLETMQDIPMPANTAATPVDTNEDVVSETETEQAVNENTVAQETVDPVTQKAVAESVSEAKEPVTKQSEAAASEQVDEIQEPTEEQTSEVLPQEVIKPSEQEQQQEVNTTEQEAKTLEQQESKSIEEVVVNTSEEAKATEQVQEEVQTSEQQAESFVESFSKRSTRKLFEQVQQLKSNFVARATNIFVKFPNLVARVKSGEDILGSLKETFITEQEQEVWDSFQRFNDFMSPFTEGL